MNTKNAILTLAKQLITIPSVSDETESLITALTVAKKYLTGYSFTPFVSNHSPSLLYSNKDKQNKSFTILLNLHLDVVPASNEQFLPYEKNGKLYGRGAYDMKAAAAVLMILFKELGNKLPYALGLQITTDEENNGSNGTGYQVKQGVTAKFVICGESGSNFHIINQAKGRSVLKITLQGTTAHSAYAWKGQNAITKMYEALTPILKTFPAPTRETEETLVSVTKIETNNDTINKIPDHCSAYLDLRINKKDEETIFPRIKQLLPPDAIIEVIPLHPAHTVDPQNPYILQLQHCVTHIRKEALPLRLAHGTSDATFFENAIEFGPIGDNSHNDNEWVDIQSLEDYYHILKKFLLSYE